jgi:hypothetical protein
VASYVYNIPGIFQSSAFGRNFFDGWDWSGVATLQTGKPFSITDATAATIYGASSYAQFAPGKAASDAKLDGRTQDRIGSTSDSSVPRYFNTSVFVPAPAIGNGTGFGNSGRNILVGPGQANFDMALKKHFKLNNEGSNLEFRSEFFNIFNHPNFANPGSARSTPSSFGVITAMSSSPRIIQFALKYQF